MGVPPRSPVVSAFLSLLLTACSNDGLPGEMHGTLERDRLELVAESHERIVEIAVTEGDRVAGGALLLRQEAGTMQPRLSRPAPRWRSPSATSPTSPGGRAGARSRRRGRRWPVQRAPC